MRDDADRRPGAVPDDEGALDGAEPAGFDVTRAVDTDGDGLPDTLLVADGPDLLVLTDLDGDGHADRMLRIDPGGEVHETDAVTGHAPAASAMWNALLGRFGLDP